jgi:hypothetical protein
MHARSAIYKGKVLPLTGHEDPGGVEVQLYSYFKLDARWEWVVNTTPRPLYPRERPSTHCTGGWVGPGTVLDGYEKSRLQRNSIPGPSSP